MQHFFTFLAPRNLKRTTLELFFSLNQWLSIRPFGRRDLVLKNIFLKQNNNFIDLAKVIGFKINKQREYDRLKKNS